MEDFIGTYGNRLILAVVGVGVALLLLAIVLWFIRRRGGSAPFIRGGKNRQPRLQVLDATAVDARRRLVLVRRDNVEHLVMIGGPTDIVIESGIGAIPFLKDVRDPQDDALPSLASERTLTDERTKSLPHSPQEEIRPVAVPVAPVAATTPAPQPEPKQPPVVPPAPRPVAATPPQRQPAPIVQPTNALQAAPARPQPAPTAPAVAIVPPAPVVPARENLEAAPPRVTAREPVAPIVPAITPAAAAALVATPTESAARPTVLQTPPPVEIKPAPAPLSIVKPEPVEAPEPVISQESAVDFLDAARERVLPTYRATPPVTATATPKPEPLAPSDNGPVFGDQLTSDFESFLEAEIAKNNSADAPAIDLDPAPQNEQQEPKLSDAAGKTADQDVQREMARIFGEMSVTRDR